MTHDPYRGAAAQLARNAVMSPDAAAKLEVRLQQAFAEQSAISHPPWGVRRWGWAAAATVAIGSGAALWYARHPPVTVDSVMTREPVGSKPARPDPTVRPRPVTTGPALRAKGERRRTPRATHSGVVSSAAFVAVPTAAGLPHFESGVILRMSLPLAALPSYGVDISPAYGDQPVEADVLVGQDGLTRAIRLVSNTTRSSK